jgi:DNA-binding beta-propeller fold protein YncE
MNKLTLSLFSVIVLLLACIGNVAIVHAAEQYAFITTWSKYGITNGNFDGPQGIAVDSSGDVYVIDTMNTRVQKFTGNGTFIMKWGSFSNEAVGKFNSPQGIAVDAEGNVYVVDTGNNKVQKFSGDGTYITVFKAGKFNYPEAVAVDAEGNVYVVDTGNNKVQKFSGDGTFITKWGKRGVVNGNFNSPQGIAVDAEGNVYVADTMNNRIQKFASNGTFVAKWGTYGEAIMKFNFPESIAVDSEGNVYVADTGNSRVQKFTANGTFVAALGSHGSKAGSFNSPQGIAVDAEGNVYVADTMNNRIQKFGSNAIETSHQVTISGTQYDVKVISASNTTDFVFDQDQKQISIRVSDNDAGGNISIEVGKVLEGPYTVMIDGEIADEAIAITEEGSISIEYPPNVQEISVSGTNVVPEFAVVTTYIIIAIAIGTIVVVGRAKLVRS